ncbi:MAG: DUF3857 domain-containing protein [Candidatus Polarisedimenticolia bacterium]
MKRCVWSLAVALLAMSVAPVARAQDAPAAPPDISAEIAAAPAYVELKELSWHFEVYETVLNVKKRVRINTAEGTAAANQKVFSFEGDDKYLLRLTAFAARTIKPDGTVVEVGPEMKHDAASGTGKIKRHVLSFTFPEAGPGATLEWEYELRRENPLPWPWWEIQESMPVKEARFTAFAKRVSGQHPDVLGYARSVVAPWCGADGDTGSEGEFDVVRFKCTQVPAYRREPLSPPENDVRLRMMFTSTYPDTIDWGAWGMWSDELRDRFDRFQKSRKYAKTLAKAEFGSGSTQERAEKIGWWVKKNIQLIEGDGNLFGGPNESVDKLLETRRGTPDEAVMLARVLAYEAGLTSYVVAVSDGTQQTFRLDLPDLEQGLHFVAEIVDKTGRWYIDPSCARCRPTIMPWWYVGGRNSGLRRQDDLRSSGGGGNISEDVPQIPASVNVLSRRERIELAADGKAKVAGEATWGGQPEQELRDEWADLKPERRAEEFLGDEPGSPAEAKVETGDVDDLSVPYGVKYSFAQADAALASDGKLVVRPRDVIGKRLGLPLDEERRAPLWWPRQFSIAVEETFVAPEGFKAAAPPEATKLAGPGLSFEGAWRAGSKPNELVYSAKVTVEKTKIALKDYPAARTFALQLRKALAAEATFEGK